MDIYDKNQCDHMKNKQIFDEYLKAQILEIEKYKWIRSEEVGYELGDNVIREWICLYAKKFRENYELNKEKYR
jgi:hypothetical protein